MTSSDGEERLLQHISQQLTREMHVARSHHSHVSVITVGGGRDVLGGRSPVHVRHPKPTRHHEGYASGPMLDGVLATGLHSALHGEALHIRNPHSIVLRQFWSRKGVFGARTRNRQNKLNLLSAGPAGLVFLSLFPASQFSGTQSAQSVHALIRSSTDSPTQACSVAHCGLHEKFTFLPFTAEKQTFHATLGS